MDLFSVPEPAGKDADPPRSYLRTEGFNSWNTGYYFNFVVLVLFLLCVLLFCCVLCVVLFVLFLLFSCFCCCIVIVVACLLGFLDILEAITMMIDQGSIS